MTTPVFIIGHDDSAHADAAIDTAIAYGEPTGAHLIIVFVRHNPPALAASTTATAAHEDALDAVAAELAAKLHTRLAGYPGKWEFCQRHGNPADELVDAAADHTANAIIVGHRGHNTLTDLLIGSVANRLVHHSPITVIVAR